MRKEKPHQNKPCAIRAHIFIYTSSLFPSPPHTHTHTHTGTMAKSNKVNDVKTHGPKGSMEDKISYHKLAFKFHKRNFLDNETPPGPITVVIDDFPGIGIGLELASLLSVCKEKTTTSGTQKISCTPFDPEA